MRADAGTPAASRRPRPWGAAIREFVRFCCVGGVGYLANLVVFAVIVRWTDASPLVAASVAFGAGWLLALGGHRRWTFNRADSPLAGQVVRYLVVSAITLGIDLGLLNALLAIDVAAVPAQAVALAAATPVSFALNRGWSFS